MTAEVIQFLPPEPTKAELDQAFREWVEAADLARAKSERYMAMAMLRNVK